MKQHLTEKNKEQMSEESSDNYVSSGDEDEIKYAKQGEAFGIRSDHDS